MEINTALISGGVSIIVSCLAGYFSYLVQRYKLLKEFKLEDSAENAISKLLNHPNWTKRTFTSINEKIGGFEDDELRKLLVRSGAVRFYVKNGSDVKVEHWGLISRNKDQLKTDS